MQATKTQPPPPPPPACDLGMGPLVGESAGSGTPGRGVHETETATRVTVTGIVTATATGIVTATE